MTTAGTAVYGCKCGKQEDLGNLSIECTTCKKWSHASCHFLVSPQTIGTDHERLKEPIQGDWFCSIACTRPKKTEIKKDVLLYGIRLLCIYGSEGELLHQYVFATDVGKPLYGDKASDKMGRLFDSTDFIFKTNWTKNNNVLTRRGLLTFIGYHLGQPAHQQYKGYLLANVLPLLH
jgi:hypothetical protein